MRGQPLPLPLLVLAVLPILRASKRMAFTAEHAEDAEKPGREGHRADSG
jgi:hypothetical protein